MIYVNGNGGKREALKLYPFIGVYYFDRRLPDIQSKLTKAHFTKERRGVRLPPPHLCVV